MDLDGIKETAAKAQTLRVGTIGDFIREQREQAQVSLRQLSKLAGVSNPYLSQIERGMRKPSADILQQIAKGLRISAEQLYIRAGILEDRQGDSELIGTILADVTLTERQKSVLIEIYESFRRENQNSEKHEPASASSERPTPEAALAATEKE
jgi:transcriptional regulator with XRE-family HTH domain